MSVDTEERFIAPLSNSQFFESIKDRIPKNTSTNTRWALSVWKEWRSWRNFREETRKDPNWPIPSLQEGSVTSLDYWLVRFICEVHRQDNQAYPPGECFYYIFVCVEMFVSFLLGYIE